MEARPHNCRNRLKDESKPYPKSGCAVCQNGGLFGCPFEANTTSELQANSSTLRDLVKQNTKVLEGVLAQMDNINEKHGTFYGGFAFFEAARQIHRNNEALNGNNN